MDIFSACRKGNINEIDALIASGVDINKQDIMGVTPIMLLAFHDNERAFFHVISNYEPNLKIKTINNNSVLSYAAKNAKVPIIRAIVEKLGIKSLFEKNSQGFNPFMIAAVSGNLNFFSLISIIRRDREIKKFITDNINNQTNFDNQFPPKSSNNILRHYTEDLLYLTRFQYLVSTNTKFIDNFNLIKPDCIVENYFSNYLGYTALMLAVKSKEIRIVRLLLELGADLNIQNKFGYSALMLSARDKEYNISSILIKNGSDLTLKSNARNLEDPFLEKVLGNKTALEWIRIFLPSLVRMRSSDEGSAQCSKKNCFITKK
jgi:ankyrin repeat protein